MSVACVLIPHLAVQVETRRRPEMRGRPVVIVQVAGSRRTVFDASPRAHSVAAGMPLQEALARCGEAAVVEADLSAYQDAFGHILDRLGTVSPVVEDGGPGAAYVDLRGLEGMYGGEARLAAALLHSVPPGYSPKVGIAGGRFPAYVAATQAAYHGAVRAPEDVRAFLAGVPVEMLPVLWETAERLRRFGLKTLGQVAAVGVGPLQAQLGRDGAAVWALASGRDERPLVPRRVEESIIEEIAFPSPTASLGVVLLGLEALIARAFAFHALRGRSVRAASLEGQVLRGAAPWRRDVGFREPIGSRERAFQVLRDVVAAATLPGPLESLRLTLAGLTGEAARQGSMFADVRRRQQLREAVRGLEARLGGWPPIYQVREVEPWSRIPERRHALVEYDP